MLFKTTTEIKNFVAINAAFDFNSIKPYIQQAEAKFIIPAVSQAQYDDLNAAYIADTLSPAQTALLAQIQLPLAYLAMMLYVPIGNIQFSDSGIQITVTEHKKPAFQWQVEELKKSFADAGFDAIETLLQFLETNKTTYTLWADSDSFTISKQFFINSAIDFNTNVNIRNSRRLYIAMQALMRKVEVMTIQPFLGKPFYDQLKTQITAETLTSANKSALSFIRDAVANYTLARAVIDLSLDISESGISLNSVSTTLDRNVKTPAPDERLRLLSEKYKCEGDSFLSMLKDFMTANIGDYPLYAAYVPAASTATPFENVKTNGYFGAL